MKWIDARNPWAQRYGSWLILGPLLVLLSSPAWWWLLARPTLPAAVIVNKTVVAGDLREHASLWWVLKHHKVQIRDYVGPHASPSGPLTRSDLAGARWVFLADTYGVHAPDQSEQGGLQPSELEALESYAQAGGRIYGEFNCLAWPTRGAHRQRLERLLGVRFTGWTGRHFQDLGHPDEASPALQTALKSKSGPGWCWLHEDGRVVTLSEGSEVPPQALELIVPHGPCVNYNYWFDIVEPLEPARAVAHFRLNCTWEGREKLRKHNLPTRFPALVMGGRSLYGCGDFSDNPLPRGPHWWEGWPRFQRWRAEQTQNSPARFYWSFYVPMLELWIGRSS